MAERVYHDIDRACIHQTGLHCVIVSRDVSWVNKPTLRLYMTRRGGLFAICTRNVNKNEYYTIQQTGSQM